MSLIYTDRLFNPLNSSDTEKCYDTVLYTVGIRNEHKTYSGGEMEDFEKWWAEHTAKATADPDFLSIAKSWAYSAWKAAKADSSIRPHFDQRTTQVLETENGNQRLSLRDRFHAA